MRLASKRPAVVATLRSLKRAPRAAGDAEQRDPRAAARGRVGPLGLEREARAPGARALDRARAAPEVAAHLEGQRARPRRAEDGRVEVLVLALGGAAGDAGPDAGAREVDLGDGRERELGVGHDDRAGDRAVRLDGAVQRAADVRLAAGRRGRPHADERVARQRDGAEAQRRAGQGRATRTSTPNDAVVDGPARQSRPARARPDRDRDRVGAGALELQLRPGRDDRARRLRRGPRSRAPRRAAGSGRRRARRRRVSATRWNSFGSPEAWSQ